MIKIAIVNYGLGNIRSVKRGLEEAGANVIVTSEKKGIFDADALVLPGVGAFESAITNLTSVSDVLLDQVRKNKPLLGICLGLQLLFTTSTEGGQHRGLNVLNGSVIKLPKTVKIPHIGWNTLTIVKPDHPLLKDVSDGAYVYFVHSYYANVGDPEHVVSKTRYGVDFPSTIVNGNVFATQFHPEKSGKTGLQVLKNFVEFAHS